MNLKISTLHHAQGSRLTSPLRLCFLPFDGNCAPSRLSGCCRCEFDLVEDAAAMSLNAQGTKEAESLLRFSETKDVLLTASRLLAPAAVFLQVEGGSSAGITIDGGDISKATTPLAFKDGAQSAAVKLRA
jgi:hypothetical protein